MCRSIKPLFNFEPQVTHDEIRAASLQFVRKISGFHKPSKANQATFDAAVEGITAVAATFLDSLETAAPPKAAQPATRAGVVRERKTDREDVASNARARSPARFGAF
ncbi:MAG TPA: DUF2277 domain-containing protein [Bryobacteraceae bacterium]|jgi:hypothetical protein|nr:DUF2277 domain-containing protein [Bryobacteraceae bacterium]